MVLLEIFDRAAMNRYFPFQSKNAQLQLARDQTEETDEETETEDVFNEERDQSLVKQKTELAAIIGRIRENANEFTIFKGDVSAADRKTLEFIVTLHCIRYNV